MTIVAIALILGAAGIHASWNLLTKRLGGGAESIWLFTLVATIVYAPLAAIVAYATSFQPGGREWIVLVGTGILQGVYFVLLRRGYAVGDLSMVYPLARGTGPLVATALAVLLLGERPSPLTIAGALIVSFGTLLFLRPVPGSNRSLALAYGLMTGMVIGCYTVWDGYAVGELAVPAVVLGWAADAGRLVCLTPVALRRREAMRKTWALSKGPLIAIGILSTASYMMVLSAMAIAPVSSIAPAREISIVIGTLFGMIILREPGGRQRVSAAVVVTAGVLLVALG